VQAGEQGEIAGDHQALDVVGVAVFQRLADGGGQAGGMGAAGPEPGGQWRGVAVLVGLGQRRHLPPIDAAHEFAPAENLPDEAFGGSERHAAGFVGGDGGGDYRARVEQLEVQRGG
jgi:hypothetical protein